MKSFLSARSRALVLATIFGGLLPGRVSSAHGILGDRFFPPTIATDDPFAVDELALPTLSYTKNGASDDGPKNGEFDAGFEFDKEIFPHFAMGISDTYIAQNPQRSRTSSGWDNLTLTAKYEVWWDAKHEAIISLGMETDIGGTGDRTVGRDPATTFTPTFYWGKGFGDLPDSLAPLQPLAVTGTLGQTFPTSSGDSNNLEWGIAVEYSLPYLEQHVKDIGLGEPFKNMIPLIEFAMETPENRENRGLTTGTINPGVLYESQYFQLGAEANIPVNERSGAHVGFTVQLWIFIDDLAPQFFGHPLFGGER